MLGNAPASLFCPNHAHPNRSAFPVWILRTHLLRLFLSPERFRQRRELAIDVEERTSFRCEAVPVRQPLGV